VLENVRRFVILLAGVTGLLAAVPAAAHAYISLNHAEPPGRSG
jgi:hypothetical protein